jgi:hypothetical protein
MESSSHVARDHFHQFPDIWTTFAVAGIILDSPRRPTSEFVHPTPPVTPQVMQNRKGKHVKRALFTESQRQILLKWLTLHQSNPYPTTIEKDLLVKETGLQREQINIWFTNNRIRQGFTAPHRFDEQRAVFPPPLRV